MADLTKNTGDLLATAQTLVSNTLNRANQTNISTSLRDGLISSSNSIQSLLNDVFKNNGLITDQQVNELDRQVELAKLQLLETQSNNTVNNLALTLGIAVVVVGLLWYFTSEKN
jgi:hypothetical protein